MMKYYFTFLAILLSTIVFGQSTERILSKYYTDDTQPGGIVLFKNNNEISTTYIGLAHLEKEIKINELTRFRLASVSKQFTSMAIYLLIQEGKISFNTGVRTIFPELPNRFESIQIKHLLNHSSGLADYENVIPQNQQNQLTDRDVLDLVSRIDSTYFEAGTKFRYSNAAYCLMSLIVERVANQSYESFCKEKIFDKLNMKTTQILAPCTFDDRAFGYHPKNESFQFADQSLTSATRGDGGVYISAIDFAKWMDKGNSLFNPQFFKDLNDYSIEVKDGIYYGLGLFFTKSTDGELTLFHSGESTGFHNIFLLQPHLNKGISLFTNRDDLKIAAIFSDLMQKENISIPEVNEPLFLWLNKVYSGN